jgi:uncharacterized cupin superfamily protein
VNVPEAPLNRTESGLVPGGNGWFVVNAREAQWIHAEGRGARLPFEGDGDAEFPQVGISLFSLAPGESMGMYHWEADQEDFLMLSGEGVLLIEGEERPLRQWDFVHCPAGTKHIIVAAGRRPCVVLAVGAREHQDEAGWGGYTVEELAQRHGVSVERETTDAREAYANVSHRQPAKYRRDWLGEGE